ncbi:MAG: valine--tRNA ligase, partial [Firmicutes bacterium]|nr:valine--tRNA ligase [Bacillota bacterium]
RKLTAVILASGKEADFMKDTQHFLKNIANVQEITFIDSKDQVPDEVMSAVMNNVEIYVPLDDLLDYKAELERLKKEKTRLEGEVKRTAGKLNNAGFVAKAPEAVVNAEREKLAKYEDMLAKIIERIPVVEAKVK